MKFLAIIFVLPAAVLFSSWMLMLGIGVLHHQWWSAIPTMGYGTALVLVLMFAALGAASSLVEGWFER